MVGEDEGGPCRNVILPSMDNSTKVKTLSAAKAELMKHSLDTFVDVPPSVAEGGRGVVVTGCPGLRHFGADNRKLLGLLGESRQVLRPTRRSISWKRGSCRRLSK